MDIKFYWKLLLRRLPVMAALFLVCAGIATAVAFKLPTRYDANARLLVEAAQIEGVGGPSEVAGAEQLEIIQQRLMTRANLIDIANDLEVFTNRASMSPDEVVDEMRASTTIRRSSGRNQATLMTIRFEAERAQTAAAVVNAYVTIILEETARFRTGRAGNNLQFFEQEVERLSADLSTQSQRILEFQTANSEALPDGQEYRLARQDALLERANRIDRDITQLTEQRVRIVSIYEATGRLSEQQERRLTPEEQQLQAAQDELAAALTVYSETNPRVGIIRTRIAQLEATVAAQRGSVEGPEEDDQDRLLQVTLAQIDGQVETFTEELEAVRDEQETLRDAISRTPGNQIALSALQRDYDNLQNQYNAAVARRNEARMGERIELSARGERISVIEQAAVPNDPSSPNRPLFVIGGAGLGMALAIAYFVLLEALNRTIRRPAELTSSLGITPLVTIPMIESVAHRRLRRTARVVMFLIVITGVPAALWAVDTYYQPLDLLADRVISRLGLS